ncbi:MAG TPA: ribosome small subunit-dependent GTPase A [Bacteroidia bacterium]|nr:ribosome small subunit-dependent GTPase A [Bacteroidia bacterium]HRS59762.1 ribosome small subunit-dependent GTPase A [Bacteroidia bacterium]HRU69239.1 ribosome small subunit-dependent GTPase A [Bacteroidia bacterium]
MDSKSGIIIKSTGSWYHVMDKEGLVYKCKLRGKFRLKNLKATNPLTVGDRVTFHWDAKLASGVIDELEERKNYIARKSSNLSRQYHIIAANLDLVLITASVVRPQVSPGFIDRYLVIAEAHEIKPVIIFNKTDLALEGEAADRLQRLAEIYGSLGYEIWQVSAKTGENLQELKSRIHGKVSLISGQSGVGKSTLLNKFNPSLNLKTWQISDFTGKGQHVTTFYEMHPVDDDTFVIDSPGLRELGLFEFEPFEISLFYPEMKKVSGACRFNTCLHLAEPGCAVRQAFENNEIYPERYQSYLKIIEDFKDEKPYYSKS